MKMIRGGVYFLYDGEELVYIGQSDNVYRRIGQHISDGQKMFDSFEVYETDDYIRLEGLLINLCKPKYNKTSGTQVVSQRRDIFSEQLSAERIGKLIEACEQKLVEEYGIPLRKVCNEIADDLPFDLVYTARTILRHYSELPLSRLDGQWYIDAGWFRQNKTKLTDMIIQWDAESWQAAEAEFENCGRKRTT